MLSNTIWLDLEGWGRVEVANLCVSSLPNVNMKVVEVQVAPGMEMQAALAILAASPGPIALGSASKVVPHGSS